MIGQLFKIPLLSFLWFFLDDFAAFISSFLQDRLLEGMWKVGVVLPRSRVMEREADLVGCKLVSRMGGDPRWGVLLWEKFECLVGGLFV